jgi:hypothetical protein
VYGNVDEQNPAFYKIFKEQMKKNNLRAFSGFPKIQLLPRIRKSNFADMQKKITFILEI